MRQENIIGDITMRPNESITFHAGIYEEGIEVPLLSLEFIPAQANHVDVAQRVVKEKGEYLLLCDLINLQPVPCRIILRTT